MKTLKPVIFMCLTLLYINPVHGIPLYAQREGVACTYCHARPESSQLNDAGKLYRRNGHFFPYQSRPKISQQYPDSKTDPRFLKLKQRFLDKYYRADPIKEYIERGKRLFHGSMQIRKKSSKTCASCHSPSEIAGVNKSYPKYVPLLKEVVNMEQMQNYCLENYLGAEPFEQGGQDSLSLSAYINSLSKQQEQ
jgi:cytochrome c553